MADYGGTSKKNTWISAKSMQWRRKWGRLWANSCIFTDSKLNAVFTKTQHAVAFLAFSKMNVLWEAHHFKKVMQNFLSLLFSQRTWLIKLLKLPMDGLTNDWKPSPFNRQNKQGQGHRHSVNGNGWIWENHLPFHRQQLPTGNNHWPMAIPSPQKFYCRPGLSVSNDFANQVEVLSYIPFTHTIPLHPSEPWFPPHLRACVTSLGRWLPQPWWGTGQ